MPARGGSSVNVRLPFNEGSVQFVANFLASFKDYPQRQKAASSNLDEVRRTMSEGAGSK